MFAIGEVRAQAGAGESRPLRKGDAVDEAETITTGAGGRVQLRFKDGALVALQPLSSLRVDRYRYVGQGDSEDNVWLSFLKGGLRTLSGVVGKKDPKAYRMDSPVATIGIRGTGYALDLSDGLLGNVSEGAVEVCNGGGCLLVGLGEAFEVRSISAPPQRTERRVVLHAPPTRLSATPAADEQSGDGARGEATAPSRQPGSSAVRVNLPPPAQAVRETGAREANGRSARPDEVRAAQGKETHHPSLPVGSPISANTTAAPLQSNNPTVSSAPVETLPAGPPVQMDTGSNGLGVGGGGSSGGGSAGGGSSGGGGSAGGGSSGGGAGAGGSPGNSGNAPGHNKTFLPPGQFKKK